MPWSRTGWPRARRPSRPERLDATRPRKQRLDQLLAQADIITVSSNEGLQNLFDLAANSSDLVRQPLIVPGERALALAKTLGFSNIHVAENATDRAFLEALEHALAELSKKQ